MGTSEGTPDASWFEELANSNETLFYVLRVKPDLAFEYVNAAVESLLGWTPEEAMTDPEGVLGVVDASHAARLEAALELKPGTEATVELIWQHRNGNPVYGQTFIRSRQREDGSVVLEGATRNVTQLHKVEAELNLSEKRYRLLVENAWDVVWTTAVDGTLTYISPAIERLRGVSAEETMQQALSDFFPPESADRIRKYFRSAIAAVRDGTDLPLFRAEHEFFHKDGTRVPAEMQVIPHIDENGRVLEIIGVTRDITERKALEAELRRLAVTDPVTGVWNRRHGEELISADLNQAHCQSLSLLMLDVDNFKAVNDTRGHQAGDRVLVEIARRLVGVCRDTDMVARWGGEEFVILLRGCALQDGVKLAEQIRATVADTPFIDAGAVTVSIGVAQATAQDDVTSWVARADDALYEAKGSGRNTVRAGLAS
ncbi:diguanylate cyclase (GGDEF)-like protein/PAS domain S-box-containing protein [Mycolicibacterium sp. BK556]|uniref:sensor domain-containing diguanylate cyclase n=1 Tax=unclassified Mycolicibacterium TaxID=2636767 RepID=UPI001607F1FC|nr:MULTISPECIES: diguanylate cyclase [unclassified Mycolicibacterium]MBB3603454.1 diguanylate cyclase (GGDEF)-like protein/PAS domain S-box-containing protein [Mycolicibacterium sp. BK556]MBB3633649.1 diguanylate cyclase (GGDEF)-like protein/PAS domain S-box-containing protein [Mycolicibacterium sp. BK607]MBB3751231.1 diguanylate cyclase (GGDEF)-like protein/PAS domain S-box-containing protein [Mycolicibacterium sp. BK634]